jgi:peptidoglycan/LPS O-acetylase OafA/YrhL
MSALIERHYANAARTWHFYLDRLSRIYPQYALYGGLAALWLFTIGHSTHFLILHPQPVDWLNNLLVVPLNYFMFNGSDRYTLVPPAWSLGAELLFYVLAPWLWRYWRVAQALALASLLVQALAWHGQLHTDWWGYRLLPGVLWIFVLGMAVQRLQSRAHGSQSTMRFGPGQLVLLSTALTGLVASYLQARGLLVRPYNREVLAGLAWGLPLLYLLTRRQPTPERQRLDAWLGDLSYGIFLNHFLIFWVFDLGQPHHAWQWAVLLAISVIMSAWSQWFIERPVLLWRRKWRVAVPR